MDIIGPDELVFGVDDLEMCRTFLLDYGLIDAGNGTYEAADGTCVILRDVNDAHLPAGLESNSTLRKTVWGVADAATLVEIEQELSKDRIVDRATDGSLSTVDDLGFAIGFQVTRRHPFEVSAERINTPGGEFGRKHNELGSNEDAWPRPLTLSHIVFFVPDAAKMERFYTERLKFTVTDRFLEMGPFMRPRGNDDHHCLFMIETPPFMQGLEHFAFHLEGPTALMQAGNRFRDKGYETFWGPGRHKLGSNWFWYFKSPMGVAVEYDADMDKHDDDWVAREYPAGADNAQLFLLKAIEKWAPGGPPPGHA